MKNWLLLLILSLFSFQQSYGQKSHADFTSKTSSLSKKMNVLPKPPKSSAPNLLLTKSKAKNVYSNSQETNTSSEVRFEKIKILFADAEIPQEWTVVIKNGRVFLADDIVLCSEEEFELKKLEKGGIINGGGYRWPNGKIPYELSEDHSKYDEILEAIETHNAQTNLCLVPRTNEVDYVEFVEDGEGCSSAIGRRGGRQIININDCPVGSIVHEICHAAGMWHEQARNDRDNYVTILFENIVTGQEYNFQKFGTTGTNVGPYDYSSIMHYSTMGFSKNGLPTIKVNIPPGTASTKIGQREGLSTGDISTLNSMYPTKYCSSDCADSFEPNGTIATANTSSFPSTLSSSKYSKIISANIGSSTDVDYYKIITGEVGTLKLTLDDLPEDYDLFLVDSDMEILDSSENSDVESEEISFDITTRSANTLFIEVRGYDDVHDCDYDYSLGLEWTPKVTTTALSVSPTSINFDAVGGSKAITVSSNINWAVSEAISWLSVSPISGSNNGTVTISSTANTSTSSRTGTITISGSGVADQQISVTQNGASVAACIVPSNVHLVQKGYSWFYVEWDKVPNITTYSFRYRKQSETNWTTNDAWGFNGLIYSIQSPCTDYVFQVRTVCGNNSFSDWSPELKFKTDGCNETYCYSYGASYEDWIKEVNFAGIKNTSSLNYGYINLTSTPPAQVEVGKSYPLGLSAGFSNKSNGDTYYWQVWIDYNQDNDFSDAGELVFSATSPKASSVAGLSKDILIPTSAKVGKTRMRVAMSLQSGESPCTTTGTGSNFREVEDYSVEIVTVAKTLALSSSTLNFDAGASSKNLSITSNTTWSVSESLSWLSVSPISGSNNGTVTISCTANTGTSSRTGTINVSGSGVADQTITITQTAGGTSLTVSQNSFTFNADGGSQSFSIKSNLSWTVSEFADWLSVNLASGSNDGQVSISCTPNTQTATRTGTVFVAGGSITLAITITQAGAAPAVCRAPSNLRNQITPDNPNNSISYSWFFVYWDAVPGATGYSARLRSVGSTSWREIKDAAVNQVDFRNLQPNTSFEVQVQSFCADGSASAWSSSLTTKTLGSGDPYCASYGDHQFGDINTVLLAGNALGGGFSQGYSFFKDKVYPLEKGRNYRIELVADDWQKSGEKPAYWRIWIDFNQDNDFNDPNELVFEAEGKNTGRVAGDLTLGTTPSIGKTRMRIALDMDGQNGPCSTKGNRDVEDYLVEIRNPGDVWNEVVQTDQSHTIVLPQTLTSDIGGVALQENDQIGIFYTEKGVDYCAGKTKWTGKNLAITVYGDDLSTPQKDGFASQEKFQVKVRQATSGNEYKVAASYAPLGTYGITNAQGQYLSDGVSVVLSLGQNLSVATQEIPLQAGWNMISAYLDPNTSHLDSILQPIKPTLQLFKNAAGKSFIFSPAINDIGTWNSTEGYRLKVSKPETLSLSGQLIDPKLAIIPIRSGWQIIPYYGQQAVAIETALNSIRDKVVIVKNNAGAVYIPGELAINTIGNLEPGQGYLLKANADAQLNYPVAGAKPGPELRNDPLLQHFQLPLSYNSGQNSTLVFPKTAVEPGLAIGDELGVFSPTGHLCGAGSFNGDNMAITVWGDDLTQAGVQGIQPNEQYLLKIWNKTLNQEYLANSSLKNWTYRENDVVIVTLLQKVITTPTRNELLASNSIILSPNPTDGLIQLQFVQNLSGVVAIQILSLDGKILERHTHRNGMLSKQVESFDLSHLPASIYQVQVRSEMGTWNKKVSIVH